MKRKLPDRPSVYKGDSRTTQWRKKKQRVAAAKGCGSLDSFFSRRPKTPNDGPLLSESEQAPLSDLEGDPAQQFTLIMGIDMADLCATYLETWLDKPAGLGEDSNSENELEVCNFNGAWSNYQMNDIRTHTQHDPDLIRSEDSEEGWQPPESAEIESAHEWLDIIDEDNDEPQSTLSLVEKCLKEAKKLRTPRLVKVITQLSAIAQYVKLRDKYLQHARTKRPCLSSSLAIARRMGKGPYFARQIRNNERYLSQHHCLPPHKGGAYRGHATLLDNEAVVHAVHRYLASQSLGTITPRNLCHHVNNVILPALDLIGDEMNISERTLINWLKKLGYLCKDVQKGMYIDGHERPDVIEAREKFLRRMEHYERCNSFIVSMYSCLFTFTAALCPHMMIKLSCTYLLIWVRVRRSMWLSESHRTSAFFMSMNLDDRHGYWNMSNLSRRRVMVVQFMCQISFVRQLGFSHSQRLR